MLLVIYNSNPQNKSKASLDTIRGWSLFDTEDWQAICMTVDSYFFQMPFTDTQLEFNVEGVGEVYYNNYEEWLADYQVSEIDKAIAERICLEYNRKLTDLLLGTDFYIPFIAQNLDDETIYPEMDVD